MAHTGIECNECGNIMWDVRGNKAYCTNCHTSRPFYSRKAGTGITPSQTRAIEQIRRYFQTHGPLAVDETEQSEYCLFYRCQTEGNVFTANGIFASIGRRGKIKILSAVDFGSTSNPEIIQHYAEMLRAHIGG